MRAVAEHGTPLVDDPTRLAGVAALGVDETAYLAATATHPTEFATGLVDLTRRGGPARLLDVVPGRSAAVLSSWLGEREDDWRSRVAVAALDPFRGYATALRSHLPGAVRVLDAFHVVELGFDAVDQVRRRVQQDTFGHRGRAGDPLYSRPPGAAPRPRPPQRPVLDPAAARAGARRPRRRGRRGLDRRPRAAAALLRHRDPQQAAAAFYRWLAFCADSSGEFAAQVVQVPPLGSLRIDLTGRDNAVLCEAIKGVLASRRASAAAPGSISARGAPSVFGWRGHQVPSSPR